MSYSKTMSDRLKEFKEKGIPIYVPGGEIKGWEYGGEFLQNPDWTAPPPPKVDPIKPIVYRCQRCGAEEADNKAIEFKGGVTREIRVCNRCVNYG